MQINAKIDDSYQQKLEAIQQATQLNTVEIIKHALDLFYEKTALTGREKNQRLLEILAGTGHGPVDGSVNYKHYVAEYLDEKFSSR